MIRDKPKESSSKKNSRCNIFQVKSNKSLRLKTKPDSVSPEIKNARGQSSVKRLKTFEAEKGSSQECTSKACQRKISGQLGRKQSFQKYPPSLSPIKKKLNSFRLYESKLKLSAESWMIYDIKNNKYKRGWKPNEVSGFSGLLRIVVLFAFCQVLQSEQSKVNKLRVRINPQHLKENKITLPEKQQKRLKWMVERRKASKILEKGTIISLNDLMQAMITTGSQDLFEYAVIFCGYILKCKANQSFSSLDTLYFTSSGQQDEYAGFFCDYCNLTLFKTLSLPQTLCLNGESQYELLSTPNQICLMFIYFLRENQSFSKMVQVNQFSSRIRHQVGYSFWEDRTVNFKAKGQEVCSDHFCKLVYRGSANYEAVCLNKKQGILMVIENSKFSMADLDVEVLEEWHRKCSRIESIGVPLQAYEPEDKTSNVSQDSQRKGKLLPLISLSRGMNNSKS